MNFIMQLKHSLPFNWAWQGFSMGKATGARPFNG